MQQRWVYNEDNWAFIKTAAKVSSTMLNIYGKRFGTSGIAQGIGRHSKEYVKSLSIKDLKDLSILLGEKGFKFFHFVFK